MFVSKSWEVASVTAGLSLATCRSTMFTFQKNLHHFHPEKNSTHGDFKLSNLYWFCFSSHTQNSLSSSVYGVLKPPNSGENNVAKILAWHLELCVLIPGKLSSVWRTKTDIIKNKSRNLYFFCFSFSLPMCFHQETYIFCFALSLYKLLLFCHCCIKKTKPNIFVNIFIDKNACITKRKNTYVIFWTKMHV